MTKEKLKQNFEKAANDYLKAFCKKHEYDYDPLDWVGGEAGTIVCVADYYVDMQTIRDDIDMDAQEKEFLAWYDYCIEVHQFDAYPLNFRSWLRGCPRRSQEEIEHLKGLQARIDELREQLEREVKKHNDGLKETDPNKEFEFELNF